MPVENISAQLDIGQRNLAELTSTHIMEALEDFVFAQFGVRARTDNREARRDPCGESSGQGQGVGQGAEEVGFVAGRDDVAADVNDHDAVDSECLREVLQLRSEPLSAALKVVQEDPRIRLIREPREYRTAGRGGVRRAEHFHGSPVDIPQARETTDWPRAGDRIDAKALPGAGTDQRRPFPIGIEDASSEQDPDSVSPAAGGYEQRPHAFIVTIGHFWLYPQVVLAT